MLEVCNLTKTFGDFKALNDLSMTVPKGAVYGLVGPSITDSNQPRCGRFAVRFYFIYLIFEKPLYKQPKT